MTSQVISFYDYRQIIIPKELKQYHSVTEEEINLHLDELSKSYSTMISVNDVEINDSVKCMDTDSKTVLLFPGKNLPGALIAEKDVISKKLDEHFITIINNTQVELTVKEIVRKQNMSINDELIKKCNIENVLTLDQYIQRYRGLTNKLNQNKTLQDIAEYCLNEIVTNSKIAYDEEEKEIWLYHKSKLLFEALLAGGVDLRIPNEGFEIMSDEEAILNQKIRLTPLFDYYLITKYISNSKGYIYEKKDYLEEKKQLKQELSITHEIIFNDFNACEENAYMRKALDIIKNDMKYQLEEV